MKQPKVHQSDMIYRGFFDLRRDQLERWDGLRHDYTSVVMRWDAALILAQDTDGRWILNREYRHPTGQVLLGLPGGGLDPNEDPITGGQRELLEETGYWSDQLEIFGSCYPLPSICNQKIYFIHAKNAFRKANPSLDPFECIETELFTEKELHEEIQKGALVDGLLCSALMHWNLKKARCPLS